MHLLLCPYYCAFFEWSFIKILVKNLMALVTSISSALLGIILCTCIWSMVFLITFPLFFSIHTIRPLFEDRFDHTLYHWLLKGILFLRGQAASGSVDEQNMYLYKACSVLCIHGLVGEALSDEVCLSVQG